MVWENLDYTRAALIDVFYPLWEYGQQFTRPWSIAEWRLAQTDVMWVRQWFQHLPACASHWPQDNYPRLHNGRGVVFSDKGMIGALLLVLACEVCRAEGDETSVWPHVYNALPRNHSIRVIYFPVNNYPSPYCLQAMSLAVSAEWLNLRNVIGMPGSQQYFETIKLQFGLTRRALELQLGEWLAGYPLPQAAQWLTGEGNRADLKSDTFGQMMKELAGYRRGAHSREQMRRILEKTPWVRPEWIDGVLEWSCEVIVVPERTAVATPGPNSITPELVPFSHRAESPVAGIRLRWNYPAQPALSLFLNREAIAALASETESRQLLVTLDGSAVLGRWDRAAHGGWPIPEELSLPGKQLRPRILAISTREGESLGEFDLESLGLWEAVLVFDVQTGEAIDPEARVRPCQDYNLVCHGAMMRLHGVNNPPSAQIGDTRFYRLVSPWPADLRVENNGVICWQPMIAITPHPVEPLAIRITSEQKPVDLLTTIKLFVEGIPEGTEKAWLLCDGKTLGKLIKDDLIWRTEGLLRVDVKFTQAGRIKVLLQRNGRTRLITPKIGMGLRGMTLLAYHAAEGWERRAHAAHLPLARSRNATDPDLTVYSGGLEDGTLLYEGLRKVGQLCRGTFFSSHLAGWGEPLEAHVPDAQEPLPLASAVTDRGCISRCLPNLGGAPLALELTRMVEPGVGIQAFALHVREAETRLESLPTNAVTVECGGQHWNVQAGERPLALAIASRGECLGAWWHEERLACQLMHQSLCTSLFAALRWLHAPVLEAMPLQWNHNQQTYEGTLFGAMQAALRDEPVQFVKGWWFGKGLPNGLRHHDDGDSHELVLRRLLWDWRPDPQRRRNFARALHNQVRETLVGDDPHGNVTNTDALALYEAARVCPPLAWLVSDNNPHRKLQALRLLLGLPVDASQERVGVAIQQLEMRLGMDAPQELTGLTQSFINWVTGRNSMEHCQDLTLRRLGELPLGRRYLGAKLLSWLHEKGEGIN